MNRRRVERAPRITIDGLKLAAGALARYAEVETGDTQDAMKRLAAHALAEADAREFENETRRQVNADRKARRGILA